MMSFRLIRLLVSGLVIAVLVTLFNATVGGIFAFLLGNAISSFLVLWGAVIAIILFDDAIILPLTTKLLSSLGIEK